MIKGIQGNTGKTIKSLELWKKDVESSIEQAGEAENALKMIVVSVNSVTDRVQHIAAAAEEQSNTGNSITSNVESVAGISEQTAEAAQEASTSVNELNELAHNLHDLVGRFKVRTKNISDAEMGMSSPYAEKDQKSNTEQC